MNTRNLYLVRHGKPDFPQGERRCIGRTDLELSEKGRKQARALKNYFQDRQGLAVFSSPLLRASQTAQILAGSRFPVTIQRDLQELDMGEWENRPLSQIRKTLESEPEQGEKRIQGLARFRQAVDQAAASWDRDLVLVSHAGISSCFLSQILGTPLETCRTLRQPYGGITQIQISPDGGMKVIRLGEMPQSAPDEEDCQELLERFQTPEPVRRHCEKVREKALEIGRALEQSGLSLDMRLIGAAALLHDIARARPGHQQEGARILEREGYPQTARIILVHHDMDDLLNKEKPDEADVVYLADKLVEGEKDVTLDQRFAGKLQRYAQQGDQEALKACRRRLKEAQTVMERVKKQLQG